MSACTDLLTELIAVASITPEDADCQAILIKRLTQLGFTITPLPDDPVSNFWAKRGQTQPLLAFAGHTDVVPSGPVEQWRYPPFQATIDQDFIYGRGVADMKGALAAMVVACERFIEQYPDHRGSIGFIITSGEEGDHYHQGTPTIMQHLADHGETIAGCIVGEPSSTDQLGDVIKIGRRGSLSATLTIHGKQGHVAYPQLAINPIHQAAPFITELTQTVWDHGTDHFPPTTLQISNLHSGVGATNVIPADLVMQFNLRYNPTCDHQTLQHRIEHLLDQHALRYTIDWTLSGEPFLTEPGPLIDVTTQAIVEVTGQPPTLSTSGGTSDARFIAPYDIPVIELGVSNRTIHQINERVAIVELEQLVEVYYRILCQWLLN
ncbi:MAG: succinyl-diaminopimelate desuccinylase [Legionellales bacterium]|nr:succinyl-diaminopimelate desuccinylase [Legionellales bacterium]